MIELRGHSDDVIGISGDVSDELYFPEDKDAALIIHTPSGDHLVRVSYARLDNHYWDFEIAETHEPEAFTKVPGNYDDEDEDMSDYGLDVNLQVTWLSIFPWRDGSALKDYPSDSDITKYFEDWCDSADYANHTPRQLRGAYEALHARV